MPGHPPSPDQHFPLEQFAQEAELHSSSPSEKSTRSTSDPLEPSRAIDAAICDLLQAIETFSDPDFDSQWVEMRAAEIEATAIRLIQYWTEILDGRLLSGILLSVREGGRLDT